MELQGEMCSGEKLSVVKNIVESNVSFQQANGNGRAEETITHEPLAVRVRSSASNSFTIRGYVAGVREGDINKCWPFPPHLLERRLHEGFKNILPPLEIHRYRYWGCPDCVEGVIPSDRSPHQRNVDQQFDASNADAFITNGPQNLSDGLLEKEKKFFDRMESTDLKAKSQGILKEDEPEEEKVAQNQSVDTRSEGAHSDSYEKVCHVKDEVVEDKALEHLTIQKFSLDLKGGEVDQLYSENETVVCKLASQPIESELKFPANHSISNGAKNQIFSDEVTDQRAAEVYKSGSNVAENTEVIPHTSVTIDTLEYFRTVKWSCDENQGEMARANEMEQITNETPVSNTLTSTIDEDKVGKDVCATQVVSKVDADNIIPKRMKLKAKRQNEKGKAQKKRLIADLIAIHPSDQFRRNARNHNCLPEQTPNKLKTSFQRSKIVKNQAGSKDATQAGLKDATHNLKKLKSKRKCISKVHSASGQTCISPEKSHSESLEMKRKRQRLGIAAQPSNSTRSVNESRMANERELVRNTSERPQADHLSRSSRKKVLIQELIKDETKTQGPLESDDVLMDLAGFMAQNQHGRHAALPSPGIIKENKCFRGFGVLEKSPGNNPNYVVSKKLEQLGNQFQQQSNPSSRQILIRGQSAFKCIPHEVVSEDGQVCLVVERGHQQINQVQEFPAQQKLDVLGLSKKTGTISEMKDGIVSDSRHYLDIITRTNEKNLDHRGRPFCPIVMKGQKDKGSSAAQRKKSAVQMSFKESNPSSMQTLLSEQDAFRCIPAEVLSKYSQVYPITKGEQQQTDPLQGYLMPEKMDVSGQIKKTSTISEIQDMICQGSRDCLDIITVTGENNLDHTGKLVTSIALTGQKEKGSKKKKTAVPKSIKGSNSSLRQGLAGEQDASDVMLEDGRVCLQGGLQHTNPVQVSFMPEELDVSGQAKQIGTISETGVGIVSGSKDCSDINRSSGERNLGHRGKLMSLLAMKGQKERQFSTSKRQKSATYKPRKESNSSSKQGKEDDQAYVVAEGGHLQSIQEKVSLMPQKLDTFELSKEARATSGMQGGIISGTRGFLDTTTRVDGKKMGHRGELVNSVAMKEQRDKGCIASQSKRYADLKSMKESDLSLKEGLVRWQDAFGHIPAEVVLEDAQMDLIAVRGNQQINQVRQSMIPEKLTVSGKSAESRTIPGTWDQNVSGLRDCSDIMASGGEENLGFRGNLVSSDAVKEQENKRSSTSQRKKSHAHKSSKESGSYSNQGLLREDTLRCIPCEVDLENGRVVLVAIRNQQTNQQLEESLITDSLDVPEQAMEAGTVPEKRDGIVLDSRGCLDILKGTGDESMVNRGKLAKCVVMKGQKDKGAFTSQRKNSAVHKSIKELKALAKSSRSRVTIIEETNAALNAALANAKACRPAFADTIVHGHSNHWDQSLHSSIATSMALESLQTVAGDGFSPAQTLVQTVVSPTSKIREQLFVDNCCTHLTLNSQGLLADSSPMQGKHLELKTSYPRDNDLHQRTNCSKLESPAIAPATVYNSQIGVLQPAFRSEDTFTKPIVQLIDRNFTCSSRSGDAEQMGKNQAAFKYSSNWVQSSSHGTNASASRGFAMQSSSSATCLPVKSFVGPNRSQYLPSSSGSCTSLGCILPYVTFTAPSVKSTPDWVQRSNHTWPLISSPTFSFAQGSKIGIRTTLSEETFSHNKFDLQSYIQERIEAHRPTWASVARGSKRTASTVAQKGARKRSKLNKTNLKDMDSCNPHGNLKADVGSLEFHVLNQQPPETIKGSSKIPTKQVIQRTTYSKSEQVLTAYQALQPEIIPIAPADPLAKTKDFASRQTSQNKVLEPTCVLGTKDLTTDLAAHALKHQKFGKKSARMVMNARNTVQSGPHDLDASKQRITCMHSSAAAAATSQTLTSFTSMLMEPLKLSAGCKHFLKPPVAYNTKQRLPIYSTLPFAQTPIGEQNFHDVHKTYTDQYGKFLSLLDKPFTMQERQFFSYSHAAGDILLGSMAETSTLGNAGITYPAKIVYNRPDMMDFLRPAVRDEISLLPEKFIGESSAVTSDKEDSDYMSHCKDPPLGLSLCSTPGASEEKQGGETVDNLDTLANSPPLEALAA